MSMTETIKLYDRDAYARNLRQILYPASRTRQMISGLI